MRGRHLLRMPELLLIYRIRFLKVDSVGNDLLSFTIFSQPVRRGGSALVWEFFDTRVASHHRVRLLGSDSLDLGGCIGHLRL